MFHVNTGKHNISFSFSHLRDVNYVIRKGTVVSDLTKCDLLVDGTEFNGLSACRKGDAFNKETGRKLALADALKQAKEKLGLTKDEKLFVWARYFDRKMKTSTEAVA